MSFSDFIDERMLISKNVLGDKEMKIKVIEVSDETTPLQWKFGDRVKVTKVIITIKHLETQKIEEGVDSKIEFRFDLNNLFNMQYSFD